MMKRLFLGIGIALALGGVAQAGDALAVDMFRHVVAQEEGNVVFSPASAEAVLHMLREGAAGQTKAELAALPYGKQGVPSAMRVESANALFADHDLHLKPTATSVHRAPLRQDPRTALKMINTWCSEHTHGRIGSILSQLPQRARLVALNAVYLKERWLRPFDADLTVEQDFHLRGGGTQRVEMMSAEHAMRYAEGRDWQAVALPYRPQQKGEPGYFIGILPRGDAREFAAALTPQKLETIRKALDKDSQKATRVQLPRFEAATRAFSLKPTLQALGVGSAFTPAADFSPLAEERIFLSDILQKCFVKVDEEGTEAAAVTAAIAADCCLLIEEEPRIIRFDRPFLWLIGDLSTATPPYFMGLMENP